MNSIAKFALFAGAVAVVIACCAEAFADQQTVPVAQEVQQPAGTLVARPVLVATKPA